MLNQKKVTILKDAPYYLVRLTSSFIIASLFSSQIFALAIENYSYYWCNENSLRVPFDEINYIYKSATIISIITSFFLTMVVFALSLILKFGLRIILKYIPNSKTQKEGLKNPILFLLFFLTSAFFLLGSENLLEWLLTAFISVVLLSVLVYDNPLLQSLVPTIYSIYLLSSLVLINSQDLSFNSILQSTKYGGGVPITYSICSEDSACPPRAIEASLDFRTSSSLYVMTKDDHRIEIPIVNICGLSYTN